ncbi:nucleotidyltransferase domain-containing protein [Nocardioides jensenii]|uniref:nucleotidyltransferase domain-containing protein n=1 Tax=Nocardioides jensenii TaxID=1843 RepID=UPI000834A582|nr:nucleotidyltransferase domain-containing protein [Nocardioides jensenii]
MEPLPLAVTELADRLGSLPWLSDLLVAGSLATGDHLPGVSDLDLVAVVAGPVDETRTAQLVAMHAELDHAAAAGADLGCVYVDERNLLDADALHPTWTHGALTRRILSGITRAELVRHGFQVIGRSPADLLPPMSDDEIRAAARAELCGYWAWAV